MLKSPAFSTSFLESRMIQKLKSRKSRIKPGLFAFLLAGRIIFGKKTQKTGENTGFSSVFFFHVLHCYLVHFGSDFWFPHPSVPAAPLSSTHNAPGFAFFGPNRVRFSLFCCFLAAKFLPWFLCTLLHSVYKLKPSVMPCRREVSFLT